MIEPSELGIRTNVHSLLSKDQDAFVLRFFLLLILRVMNDLSFDWSVLNFFHLFLDWRHLNFFLRDDHPVIRFDFFHWVVLCLVDLPWNVLDDFSFLIFNHFSL